MSQEISKFDAAAAQVEHYVKELSQLLEQKKNLTIEDVYANNAELLRALHSVHDTIEVLLKLTPPVGE